MLRDFLAGFSLEQFDFHRFTQRLLIVWLAVYAVAFLVSVARPMAFFVISCFDFAPTYYFELLSALRFAGLWLIPTAFLAAAVLLSNRRAFNGTQ